MTARLAQAAALGFLAYVFVALAWGVAERTARSVAPAAAMRALARTQRVGQLAAGR